MSWLIPIFGTETSVEKQKTVNPDQGFRGTAASVKAEYFDQATLQDVHLNTFLSGYELGRAAQTFALDRSFSNDILFISTCPKRYCRDLHGDELKSTC